MPKISIVIPSYNQASYVEETLRSILLQGYPRLEIILVEDCSTDETESILEPYLPWITLLRNEKNSGMSASINRGWKACTGDIITWISTDDVYYPGAFASAAKAYLKNPGCGAVVGAFRTIDPDSVETPILHKPRLPHSGPLDLSALHTSWRLHQVATFYTAHGLDDVGRFVREEIRHNMDRELIYRVARKHPIALVNDPIAMFRIHPKSKSWSPTNMIEMARDHASVQDYFMDDDENANRIRRSIAKARIANGYIKYAKYSGKKIGGIKALAQALRYNPRVLGQRGFYLGLLASLNILERARTMKHTVSKYNTRST